ncbi:hypothetical protein JW758_02755 [Candidatus Peregrinibacteria bacterium]|nr:hypothetical protein [Candidatus Peregrinibacteria bacterium]
MKYREVIPLKQRPDWKVILPGSKSITNRAFVCASLAKGTSRIFGALESDDTSVMLGALRKLKIKNSHHGGQAKFKNYIEIEGGGGKFKSGDITVNAGASGTTTRFVTALAVLREGKTIIEGTKRMKERPMDDLNHALAQISKSQVIKIKGDKSSQFLSALLMISPVLSKPIQIEVVGELVSKPYIDITIAVMKSFGVKVKNNSYKSFEIKPQIYKAIDYYVEGDASAASYWKAIAYLHDGKVSFRNLNKKSIQGDALFANVLKELGGIINMNSMPDVAMTLAVTAPFFKRQTKITGLSTLRLKETDRLVALENELKKIGVKVKVTKDSIAIEGQSKGNRGAFSQQVIKNPPIETYDDHRMAMCFAVVGTKIPGVVIENPSCTDKTYPEFWKDLELAYLSPIKLGKKNLVLTGMRCSGKSYLGKRIAKHLGRKFIDLDTEIEKREKMEIRKIVELYGWAYFRESEQKICSEISGQKNLVIATGGGVILEPENMEVLKKNAVNVFIFSDSSIIKERIKMHYKNRPTLTGQGSEKEIQDVWNERRDLYLKYADIVWDNSSGEVIESNIDKIF